ncbi:MRG-domain-containing protein [Butyriboletus roseoflavus]|nr:MRG-domain-containing protein [Butyriboletus roseoflavus]
MSGLTVYFDRSLGANLLYRFERPQYAEIRKAYVTGPKVQVGQEKDMSAIYGAEHLLRMLGMFSIFHGWIAWSGLLTDYASEFATDGGQLNDGCGEHRVGERLCERAALVRACFSPSRPHTSWLTNGADSL